MAERRITSRGRSAVLLSRLVRSTVMRASKRTTGPLAAQIRAVVWVGSDGRVHIDNWSSRLLKKKDVSVVVRTAIDAHDSLP